MIRKQSRRSGSLTFPVFGDDGNGALGFEVYNIQKRENGAYGYEKVCSLEMSKNISKALF